MANANYIRGRWALDGLRRRPQAVLWSDNFGTLDSTTYVNPGTGASASLQIAVPNGTEYTNFLILSDHNRSELEFTKNRIENRKRMINATMRSYHVADKLEISFSWENLPSRSFNKAPAFDPNTGKPTATNLEDYTVDGGAGGVEILDWYENHNGAFWMLLSYDKYNEFTSNQYDYLGQYNQLLQVYFSSFDYTVVKRGGTNHDLWNISVSLEEV
jgi:hypothetical protein